NNSKYTHIDPKQDMPDLTTEVEVPDDEPFVLHPGEFVLAATLEKFTLPNDLAGRLEGKSSLGRLGLLTHSTAGFIDPGFHGHITLELSNVANLPIVLWPNMKVGQLALFRMTSPADVPYGTGKLGSKYQGQRGPTPSTAYLSFRDPPVPVLYMGAGRHFPRADAVPRRPRPRPHGAAVTTLVPRPRPAPGRTRE